MIDFTNKTKQELFDLMWVGLASQRWERSISGNTCKYRYGDLRCAVGHCIPDNEYSSDFESKSVIDLFYSAYMGGSNDTLNFLTECQAAHDYSHDPELLKCEFSKIADHFQLSIPEVI